MNKNKQQETYPLDEFDRQARTAPCGVHRRPARRWQTLLPVLLVLVLGPLAAWGAVQLLGSDSSAPSTTEASTQSSTSESNEAQLAATDPQKEADKQKEEAKAEDAARKAEAEKAAAQKAEAEKAAAEKARVEEGKRNIQVVVYNTTRQTGMAAAEARKLTEAGFARVKPDNAQDSPINVTTVVYANDSDLPLAQEVARVLGISKVQSATQAGVEASGAVAVYWAG